MGFQMDNVVNEYPLDSTFHQLSLIIYILNIQGVLFEALYIVHQFFIHLLLHSFHIYDYDSLLD